MTATLPTRDQVPATDTWRVEALYASDSDWESDFTQAKELPERVASYQGRLAESAVVLADALDTWFGANRAVEKIYVYAHLRNDEDLGNSRYQAMLDRARSLYVQTSTAGAYLSPEILAIEEEVLWSWLEHPRLETYRFWLQDTLRAKPHVLSEPEERLLSMVSEPLSALQRTFSVLKNVDLSARLPEVVDVDGCTRQLSHASFIQLLEKRDRRVRKEAFDAYYAEFEGNRNTIAAVLDGGVKAHIFYARARRFPTALEAALFDDRVDVAVYSALIEAMHQALDGFYRYMALRRDLLSVDTLHLYDAYVPVVPEVDLQFTYDEAVDLVTEAVKPLGDEYQRVMRQGLLDGWVDRYENIGKRSGAYSSGSYDSMPYVLMNFTGTLDSVFTLAHELGHSMHSWYSNRAQPYHLADYRILVAEVASTANEALLHHHLMETTDDPAVRAYLIDRYLDSFRATMFRQTMFAEFERHIHQQVEGGQPLTADSLDESYYALVQRYFGDSVAFDQEDRPIAWEWSRIDHFFYNFYVYKYATGMAAAIAITRAILSEGQPAVDRYLRFLASGGSDYPLDLLSAAGVDLTTPTPVASALNEFSELVDQFRRLMSRPDAHALQE
jgi:oligoendopeptidase F